MRVVSPGCVGRTVLGIGILFGVAAEPTLARAELIHGSFGMVPVGTVTSAPDDILGAVTTSLTLPSTDVVNTGVTGNFAPGISTGDMFSVVSPLTIPVTALNVTISIPIEHFTVDNFSFTFTQEKKLVASTSGAPPVGTVVIELIGTVHDTNGVLDDNAALMQITAGQIGYGVLDLSATSNASHDPSIPEPASLAVLGLGLIGLAIRRRIDRSA